MIEIIVSVPPKYYRHFVTHYSEVLNQISREHNGVTITLSPVHSNSNKVLIKGHKDYIENVKNKINDIIIDLVSFILKLNAFINIL